MPPRRSSRAPRVSEKVEQQQIASMLRALGGRVYVMGTRRPRGDHQGTCQTPGIPDLTCFLPNARARAATRACQEDGAEDHVADQIQLLFVEVKSVGGSPSEAQLVFQAQCRRAGVGHVMGGLNAVVAWLLEHGVIREHQVPHYRLPANTPARLALGTDG